MKTVTVTVQLQIACDDDDAVDVADVVSDVLDAGTFQDAINDCDDLPIQVTSAILTDVSIS